MAKITLTQMDIEELVEEALENACACHAIGMYKEMYRYRGEAEFLLELLEGIGIWYDDVIINDYVQEMIDLLDKENFRIMVVKAYQKKERNTRKGEKHHV